MCVYVYTFININIKNYLEFFGLIQWTQGCALFWGRRNIWIWKVLNKLDFYFLYHESILRFHSIRIGICQAIISWLYDAFTKKNKLFLGSDTVIFSEFLDIILQQLVSPQLLLFSDALLVSSYINLCFSLSAHLSLACLPTPPHFPVLLLLSYLLPATLNLIHYGTEVIFLIFFASAEQNSL